MAFETCCSHLRDRRRAVPRWRIQRRSGSECHAVTTPTIPVPALQPGRTFATRVEKEHLKFSAAHFLIFANGSAERLHGHNYRVAVELEAAGECLAWTIRPR